MTTIQVSNSTQSLLGQALATASGPPLLLSANDQCDAEFDDNHTSMVGDDPSQDSFTQQQLHHATNNSLFLPIHSDFTVPTSNCRRYLAVSPPEVVIPPSACCDNNVNNNNNNNDDNNNSNNNNNKNNSNSNSNHRRSVLGGRVQNRYYRYRQEPMQQKQHNHQHQQNSTTTSRTATIRQSNRYLLVGGRAGCDDEDDSDPNISAYQHHDPDDSTLSDDDHHHQNSISDFSPQCSPPLLTIMSSYQNHHSPHESLHGSIDEDPLLLSSPIIMTTNTATATTNNNSRSTNAPLLSRQRSQQMQPQQQQYHVAVTVKSSSTLSGSSNNTNHRHHNNKHNDTNGHSSSCRRRNRRPHETVHAQSLVLGIAFMFIWSPNNIMAPNLTEMAATFGFNDQERDLYLGSYCALALGVFSFPISAAIGLLTDLVPSRKNLFVWTVWGGALSSLLTGFSKSFPELLLFRFFNGGFMSASVSITFSLLGDLFAPEERNAASSGLTAMMGMGIFFGQVYAGVAVGSNRGLGWPHAFHVSAIFTFLSGCLVWLLVQEPVRGAKEPALQDLIQQGAGYDRKLTVSGFIHAMIYNRSNAILLWQGFFSSIPWGILFVFLNDFLSQEKGFSVPDATFLIFVFGMGGALGGILGGWWGQAVATRNRSYLPIFMAVTTFLGIFPFLGLIHGTFTSAHGWGALACCSLGGIIASLPSVNVRPCLINVNPPETRGATLTAANLIINVARGVGPSCITLLMSMFHISRQDAFSVALSVFWIISALQLLLLARTLVEDEQAMEHELARYAAICILANKPVPQKLQQQQQQQQAPPIPLRVPLTSPSASMTAPLLHDGSGSVVGIEPFDSQAAHESFVFVQKGITELGVLGDSSFLHCRCGKSEVDDDEEDDDDVNVNDDNYQDLAEAFSPQYVAQKNTTVGISTSDRRQLWRMQEEQYQHATEVEYHDARLPPSPNGVLWNDESGPTRNSTSGPSNERTRLIPR